MPGPDEREDDWEPDGTGEYYGEDCVIVYDLDDEQHIVMGDDNDT